VSFRRFKTQYLDTQGNGAVEANSFATIQLHLNHFEKALG
jgi:hypothetical protein